MPNYLGSSRLGEQLENMHTVGAVAYRSWQMGEFRSANRGNAETLIAYGEGLNLYLAVLSPFRQACSRRLDLGLQPTSLLPL